MIEEGTGRKELAVTNNSGDGKYEVYETHCLNINIVAILIFNSPIKV